MRFESTAYEALQTPPGDRHDCAVRALAIAAQMSYADAHEALRAEGRLPGRGTPVSVSTRAYQKLGFIEHDTFVGPHFMTLAQFIKAHPTGRFILGRSGHAFALIDGVVHDWSGAHTTGPRSRVRRAWQVA